VALLELEKAEWRSFFDLASKVLIGKRAEIEVASLAIGDQIVARWLPLRALVYDPRSDLIEIILDGLEHMVYSPRQLFIEGPQIGCSSFGMTDRDGSLWIIRLRDPLMLPAAFDA